MISIFNTKKAGQSYEETILVDMYMNCNLGDDMFLDYMLAHYPNKLFKIIVYNRKCSRAFINKYCNAKSVSVLINIRSALRLFRLSTLLIDYYLALKHDSILLLGGSIFQESPSWEKTYTSRINLIRSFRRQNKRVVFAGCNFGPYSSEAYYLAYKKMFLICSDVCFRDKYSYNLFSDNPVVRYCPDILWDYALPDKPAISNIIGISVIDPYRHIKDTDYYQQYISIHTEFCRLKIQSGYKILLFAFCKYEGDLRVAQAIAADHPNIEIVVYEGNISKFLNKIVQCSKFMATRFHANLLAIKLRLPLIPIVYQIKTDKLLDDIGYRGKRVYINKIDDILTCDFQTMDRLKIDEIITESRSHLNL